MTNCHAICLDICFAMICVGNGIFFDGCKLFEYKKNECATHNTHTHAHINQNYKNCKKKNKIKYVQTHRYQWEVLMLELGLPYLAWENQRNNCKLCVFFVFCLFVGCWIYYIKTLSEL